MNVSSVDRPRLSLLVPVYNVRPWLEQCLDSILASDYTELEILLVDDGSTDGSGALCDEYAARDERIVVVHQSNAGLSAARNAAMERMTGDFFACIDSDDWIPKTAFAVPMEYLQRHPEIDILELGYQEVNETTGERRYVVGAGWRGDAVATLQRLAHLDGVTGMAWGKIYRSSVMRGLRFPVGRSYEDTSFVVEALARANSYRYLSWLGYFYRVGRSGSITERYDARLGDLFANLLDVVPELSKHHTRLVPLVAELGYHRLLIFSLWAVRNKSLSPNLLGTLLPYTARFAELPQLGVSRSEALKRWLFLSSPRLFLWLKGLMPQR